MTLHLAAIRTRHRAADAVLPDTHGARLVLRGYTETRARAKTAGPVRGAPAVPAALRAMLATVERTSPIGARDAALLLGIATAARRSQLAALNLADLVETDDGLEVNLYRAEVQRHGPVAVPYGANPASCPIRALRAWHTVLINKDGP